MPLISPWHHQQPCSPSPSPTLPSPYAHTSRSASWTASVLATAKSCRACSPCTMLCRASTLRVRPVDGKGLCVEDARAGLGQCRISVHAPEAALHKLHAQLFLSPASPPCPAVCGQLTAVQQQQETAMDRLQRLAERLALTQQEKVGVQGG